LLKSQVDDEFGEIGITQDLLNKMHARLALNSTEGFKKDDSGMYVEGIEDSSDFRRFGGHFWETDLATDIFSFRGTLELFELLEKSGEIEGEGEGPNCSWNCDPRKWNLKPKGEGEQQSKDNGENKEPI
jgi:hypothetical protein